MNSAVNVLLADTKLPRVTNKRFELFLNNLFHVLWKSNTLEQVITEALYLSEIPVPSLDTVQSLSSDKSIIALYHSQKPLNIYLKLLPHLLLTQQYKCVTVEVEQYLTFTDTANKAAEMNAALKTINKTLTNCVILRKDRTPMNELHILRYKDKAELLQMLKDHKLMSPKVLDKLDLV